MPCVAVAGANEDPNANSVAAAETSALQNEPTAEDRVAPKPLATNPVAGAAALKQGEGLLIDLNPESPPLSTAELPVAGDGGPNARQPEPVAAAFKVGLQASPAQQAASLSCQGFMVGSTAFCYAVAMRYPEACTHSNAEHHQISQACEEVLSYCRPRGIGCSRAQHQKRRRPPSRVSACLPQCMECLKCRGSSCVLLRSYGCLSGMPTAPPDGFS